MKKNILYILIAAIGLQPTLSFGMLKRASRVDLQKFKKYRQLQPQSRFYSTQTPDKSQIDFRSQIKTDLQSENLKVDFDQIEKMKSESQESRKQRIKENYEKFQEKIMTEPLTPEEREKLGIIDYLDLEKDPDWVGRFDDKDIQSLANRYTRLVQKHSASLNKDINQAQSKYNLDQIVKWQKNWDKFQKFDITKEQFKTNKNRYFFQKFGWKGKVSALVFIASTITLSLLMYVIQEEIKLVKAVREGDIETIKKILDFNSAFKKLHFIGDGPSILFLVQPGSIYENEEIYQLLLKKYYTNAERQEEWNENSKQKEKYKELKAQVQKKYEKNRENVEQEYQNTINKAEKEHIAAVRATEDQFRQQSNTIKAELAQARTEEQAKHKKYITELNKLRNEEINLLKYRYGTLYPDLNDIEITNRTDFKQAEEKIDSKYRVKSQDAEKELKKQLEKITQEQENKITNLEKELLLAKNRELAESLQKRLKQAEIDKREKLNQIRIAEDKKLEKQYRKQAFTEEPKMLQLYEKYIEKESTKKAQDKKPVKETPQIKPIVVKEEPEQKAQEEVLPEPEKVAEPKIEETPIVQEQSYNWLSSLPYIGSYFTTEQPEPKQKVPVLQPEQKKTQSWGEYVWSWFS